MNQTPMARYGMVVFYAGLPGVTYVVVAREAAALELVVFDVVLASVPMLLLASITWRLIWPKWKRFGKVVVHPCLYAILSVYIGHWSVVVAWIHQGLFGLGGHIWFSRKHGFTWYAVEDPERYVSLSKAMVDSLRADTQPPR